MTMYVVIALIGYIFYLIYKVRGLTKRINKIEKKQKDHTNDFNVILKLVQKKDLEKNPFFKSVSCGRCKHVPVQTLKAGELCTVEGCPGILE